MRLRLVLLLACICALLLVPSSTSSPAGPSAFAGFLIKPVIQPMDIAAIAYAAGWHDPQDIVMAVSVALAESQGYAGSYNDNVGPDGIISSRDCGLWQINIPTSLIGTAEETRLRTDLGYNAARAFLLWQARGWQPWAAYNSGVAFDDSYQARALLGVVNWLGKTQVGLQRQVTTRKAFHTLRIPFVTRTQLRVLYPAIPLG
jgi:hypothetical protein